MYISNEHRDFIIGFENIYCVLCNKKVVDVNIEIRNEFFLYCKFKIGLYHFYFSFSPILEYQVFCRYYSEHTTDILTKTFDTMQSFIEFLNDSFVNVK